MKKIFLSLVLLLVFSVVAAYAAYEVEVEIQKVHPERFAANGDNCSDETKFFRIAETDNGLMAIANLGFVGSGRKIKVESSDCVSMFETQYGVSFVRIFVWKEGR